MKVSKAMACGLVAALALAGSAVAQPETFKWDGNVPIPDNTGQAGAVLAEIMVPAGGAPNVGDVNVDTIITHTWQGDLLIELEHLGNRIGLVNRPGVPQSMFGFSENNYGNIGTGAKFILDDEAASVYDVGAPGVGPLGILNVTGPWRPESALSIFDGGAKAGSWRLWVSDHAPADLGAIRNFGLAITAVPEPTTLGLLAVGALATLRRRRSR